MTRVSVSVISTGEGDKLASCLESIARQSVDAQVTVVIVDNGSSERISAEALPPELDCVLIRNDERRSFAENHNAALAAREFDFGVILNPDVIVERDCIEQLMSAAARHPRAAMIAPLLRFPSGEPQPSARRFPRLAGTIMRRTPLRRVFETAVARSAHYLPPPHGDREIDWALGACLLLRADAWRALGGFDESFAPLYVEDVDIAWRAWASGWEVWQTSRACALHEHQAVTDKTFFDRRTVWHARNMLRFVTKHPSILLSAERPRPTGDAAIA